MAGKKRSTTSNPSSSPSTSLRSLPSATSPPQQPATSTPVKIPVSIRKPPTKVPLLKRWWLFYEGSFALSMLETWEKILLHTFGFALLLLFYIAVSRYLPARLTLLNERIRWYLYGMEGVKA